MLKPKAPVEDDEDESLRALVPNLRSESDWIRLFQGKISVTVEVIPPSPATPVEPTWLVMGGNSV